MTKKQSRPCRVERTAPDERPTIAVRSRNLASLILLLLGGCGGSTVVRSESCPLPRGGGPPIYAAAIATPPAPLLEEAKRELRNARSTAYTHSTNVDEEEGVFEFDCSGFVDYVLRLRAPDALAAIPIGPKGRVRAEDFVSYFRALDESSAAPWMRVDRVAGLRAGDVVAWLRAADSESKSTGHVAIVSSPPTCIARDEATSAIGGVEEWLVRVVDSTEFPHADDSREEAHAKGLGEGTIGLVVDESGAPVGYRWKGGVSRKAHATTIALARLRIAR